MILFSSSFPPSSDTNSLLWKNMIIFLPSFHSRTHFPCTYNEHSSDLILLKFIRLLPLGTHSLILQSSVKLRWRSFFCCVFLMSHLLSLVVNLISMRIKTWKAGELFDDEMCEIFRIWWDNFLLLSLSSTSPELDIGWNLRRWKCDSYHQIVWLYGSYFIIKREELRDEKKGEIKPTIKIEMKILENLEEEFMEIIFIFLSSFLTFHEKKVSWIP